MSKILQLVIFSIIVFASYAYWKHKTSTRPELSPAVKESLSTSEQDSASAAQSSSTESNASEEESEGTGPISKERNPPGFKLKEPTAAKKVMPGPPGFKPKAIPPKKDLKALKVPAGYVPPNEKPKK